MLFTYYKMGMIDEEMYKEGIEKLDEIELDDQGLNTYITYLYENGYVVDEEQEVFQKMIENMDKTRLLKIKINQLKNKGLTSQNLEVVVKYFKENFQDAVPEWFEKLFGLAKTREAEPKIYESTHGKVVDEVKWLQSILDSLGFCCMADGKYGNGTDDSLEDFKRYHNKKVGIDELEVQDEDSGGVKELVDFKTIAHMMVYYMSMEKKQTLLFDSSKLTYFSGNVDRNWENINFIKGEIDNEKAIISDSIYYDLETVPIIYVEGYINELGLVDKSRKYKEVKLSNCRLIANTEVSTELCDEKGNQKLVDNDKNKRNEVILFKDPKDTTDTYRLMIKWLTDKPIMIGTLEGYIDDDIIYSTELIVNKPNLSNVEMDKDKYNLEFDNYLLNKIEQVMNDKGKGFVIPLQIIRALINQESKYNFRAYRYEPFFDLKYCYYGESAGWTSAYNLMKSDQYKKEVGYLEKGDEDTWTIYEVFFKNCLEINKNADSKKYGKGCWPNDLIKMYDDLKENEPEKANRVIEIYLNYGSEVAKFWYLKKQNDLLDPVKDFEEKWNELKKTCNNSNIEVADEDVDKTKLKEILKGDLWLKNKQEDDKRYKEIIDELIDTNDIYKLKKFLKLYIEYQYQLTIEWYEKNRDIEKELPKPFIAQVHISASYGLMQLMYVNAWYYNNYREFPEGLYDYKTNIDKGIEFFRRKYIESNNSVSTNVNEWVSKWNKALKDYNGGKDYKNKVRNKEKFFVPQETIIK